MKDEDKIELFNNLKSIYFRSLDDVFIFRDIICEYILNDINSKSKKQLDVFRPIVVKPHIDLNFICSGRFEQDEEKYYIRVLDVAPECEFIYVYKNSREVVQVGFNALVEEWYDMGYIENR